jgi:hypothetical protein
MGDEGREEGQAIGPAFLSAALAIGLYALAHFLPAARRGECPERVEPPRSRLRAGRSATGALRPIPPEFAVGSGNPEHLSAPCG